MQRRTWGQDYPECVPPALFMICRKLGGVAAGAFDADGHLIGMVYGLTGLRKGKLIHWSHMLAVDLQWRNRGVGTMLKQYQRDQLVDLGVAEMNWTFDPLVARNAYLNINRLHCRMQEYVVNIYGDGSSSPLHRGIGTDRLIAAWDLNRDPVGEREREAAWDEAPVLDSDAADESVELPLSTFVRIAIPGDIQALKEIDAAMAIRYRHATRRALPYYLSHGYIVARLCRTGSKDPAALCYYELERT